MMWKTGNHWAEGRNINGASMASFHTMMHGIHVLLVDHDTEALAITAKNLELCNYKVTLVELASAGLSLLLSKKVRIDVVMANINSPDLHGLKLLQNAVSMCIPVVLMSNDDNSYIAMRALEDGAFLYIKKPPTMEFLKCLWQHVIREKKRMLREREMMFVASNNFVRRPVQGIEFGEVLHPHFNPNPNSHPHPQPHPYYQPDQPQSQSSMMKNKGMSKSRGRDYYYDPEENESERKRHLAMQKSNVKRKMCTEWTEELHAKFMAAIEQLGEGRCFPKEIMEVMNEPGLTRMQVASHLQKCRNDNWRSPEERRTMTYPGSHHQTPSANTPDLKPRRFGSKPVQTGSFSGQGSGTHSESEMGNGSSKPSDHNDQFFNFLDRDSQPRDLHQESAATNNPGRAKQEYRTTPTPTPTPTPTRAYNYVQNFGETSSQARSNWSSDTSNFESNESES